MIARAGTTPTATVIGASDANEAFADDNNGDGVPDYLQAKVIGNGGSSGGNGGSHGSGGTGAGDAGVADAGTGSASDSGADTGMAPTRQRP